MIERLGKQADSKKLILPRNPGDIGGGGAGLAEIPVGSKPPAPGASTPVTPPRP